MLTRFPSDKINGTKNALFFFVSPNSSQFYFISDSYKIGSTRFGSLKLLVEFSILDSVSFELKFIFLFKKMHGLFNFKTS